ncbi:DNA-binding transcriptional regulator, LysR family [Rhizobium mongolense subsp. loessense]|uniref:HTH-type transcriptional regulator TtuA n=1 Tax=Rhizobium mongolense subsp. loessense TaxID=158890 RepID=A0A1G4TJH9_9HYPH|nr:LysR family transcriptional regulator [Rhizobium mongolense]SCW81417.1 DNA-binding transcriptional regulator, LysR family [Rhizobium mongolense subsp. loessense]
MELRQLQYFVAAAKAEHFTKAAQRLNIVQSALSSSVRALEQELNAQLFVRTTRKVRLTAAGRALLEKAEIVLDAAKDAREAVSAVAQAKSGKLNLGTVQGLPAFVDLPFLLARFHKRHPHIDVRLIQGGAAHLLEKVRNGKLDLAFLPMFDPPSDISTVTIACEELVVVCNKAHSLAARQVVSLDEIAAHAFVEFEQDLGTRKIIDDLFLTAHIDRKIAFEVSDLGTLMELVGHGLGIALVPESVARSRAQILSVCRLKEADACWEVVLASSATSGDALPRRFEEIIGSDAAGLEV